MDELLYLLIVAVAAIAPLRFLQSAAEEARSAIRQAVTG
jgi:hypothetical protein